MMSWVFYAIIFVIIVNFLIKKYRSLSIHNNSVICFSGGLGSGKSFMAVNYAIKRYRQQMFWYRLGLVKIKPYIVSNIPIRINRKKWSCLLTREHLLLYEALPPGAIVLIDELGEFANQFSYNNPYVMGSFTELVRFYRHYINGKFIFTDQSLANVIFTVKRRTVINYCLENFKKGMGLIFWSTYKIDVSVLRVVDGEVSNVNTINSAKSRIDFFYGLMPLIKHYDSRCYSDNYKPVVPFDASKCWQSYKTDYVVDLSATPAEIRSFKKGEFYNLYIQTLKDK